MKSVPSLADVVFGPQGAVSKKELKSLYKAASSRQLKQDVQVRAPELKLPGIWAQVRSTFPSLFQLPASELFLNGWEKLSQIGAALFPAEAKADQYITVPLHDHTFRSEHKPRIELYYQGNKISTLEFVFRISLQFKSLLLVFRQGKLMEIQPGTCNGTAQLQYGSHTIFQRKIVEFAWPGHITLDQQQEHPEKVISQSISTTEPVNQPKLPPLKKKRGCGCFFMLLIIGCAVGAGIFLFTQNNELFMQLRDQVVELLNSFRIRW